MSIHELSVSQWGGHFRATLKDCVALTKPHTLHLVVGVIPAMLLAQRGVIAPVLIGNVVGATILMTAGANTLNCVGDADIDKLMVRTAGRPLARNALSTRFALTFGIALSAGAILWLWQAANLLAALLAAVTIAFYALIYTLLIKRRTAHNVVWGGLANGMPVLIGWSAVTGAIGWQAVVMLAIVFFWTPPHSWALAIMRKQDYVSAGVPMLPAVAAERNVARRILIYSWLTGLTTVVLAIGTGAIYDAVGVLAASWFVGTAYQLDARTRRGQPIDARHLFCRASIYLAMVLCALAVDSALALPTTPHWPASRT
ncbi:heme o synthase [Mycobacterium sp. ACS1612]|uniref:heme o synthase n=1 Tax=Mycobacterium sp. ACS1612 TaxID=1834117 RepID=UPI000AAA1E2A